MDIVINEELIFNRSNLVNAGCNEKYSCTIMLKDMRFVVVTLCRLCSFSFTYVANGGAIMVMCTMLYSNCYLSAVMCTGEVGRIVRS